MASGYRDAWGNFVPTGAGFQSGPMGAPAGAAPDPRPTFPTPQWNPRMSGAFGLRRPPGYDERSVRPIAPQQNSMVGEANPNGYSFGDHLGQGGQTSLQELAPQQNNMVGAASPDALQSPVPPAGQSNAGQNDQAQNNQGSPAGYWNQRPQRNITRLQGRGGYY